MGDAPILDLSIDSAATVAPYEQIRAQIATAIAAGSLVVGTRLPTVRTLAAQLGVAVNTVARSYRELEAAGLVETGGRSGTRISTAGDATRKRVVIAARDYAVLAVSVGVGREEAARIVAAALDDA